MTIRPIKTITIKIHEIITLQIKIFLEDVNSPSTPPLNPCLCIEIHCTISHLKSLQLRIFVLKPTSKKNKLYSCYRVVFQKKKKRRNCSSFVVDFCFEGTLNHEDKHIMQ
jgi:hypothetical protein